MSKQPGRPRKYASQETKDHGAPKLSFRFDPGLYKHVQSQPEPRIYLENLVRSDIAATKDLSSTNIQTLVETLLETIQRDFRCFNKPQGVIYRAERFEMKAGLEKAFPALEKRYDEICHNLRYNERPQVVFQTAEGKLLFVRTLSDTRALGSELKQIQCAFIRYPDCTSSDTAPFYEKLPALNQAHASFQSDLEPIFYRLKSQSHLLSRMFIGVATRELQVGNCGNLCDLILERLIRHGLTQFGQLPNLEMVQVAVRLGPGIEVFTHAFIILNSDRSIVAQLSNPKNRGRQLGRAIETAEGNENALLVDPWNFAMADARSVMSVAGEELEYLQLALLTTDSWETMFTTFEVGDMQTAMQLDLKSHLKISSTTKSLFKRAGLS